MNGTRILVEADTATTVNELCANVSERIGLADRSGFSIYVTLGHRVGHSLPFHCFVLFQEYFRFDVNL